MSEPKKDGHGEKKDKPKKGPVAIVVGVGAMVIGVILALAIIFSVGTPIADMAGDSGEAFWNSLGTALIKNATGMMRTKMGVTLMLGVIFSIAAILMLAAFLARKAGEVMKKKPEGGHAEGHH